MAAIRSSEQRTPVWWTVFCGVLGAGAGLLVAGLWTRAGTWVADRSSGMEGPTALAVAIFMTGLVWMIVVALLGVAFPYAVATALLHVLLLLPLAYEDDVILDRRGERVTATVSDVRAIEEPKTGHTGHNCRIRLPDGTEREVAGPGCDGDTRTGDRLTVHWDPRGEAAPKLEVQVTAEQQMWLVRAAAAGFLLVGARVGVHVARR